MNKIDRKKAIFSLLAVAALVISTLGMFAPEAHAQMVSITGVSTLNDVVAQGFVNGGSVEIHIMFPVNVVVTNTDSVNNETATVGIYIDAVLASTKQLVELTPGETRTLGFLWDTFGAALGNHTLSASIDGGETFVDGVIQVIFPGDVNQDGIVDMRDISAVAASFNAMFDDTSRFNHYADLNGDGRIDMRDIGICAANFMKSYTLP